MLAFIDNMVSQFKWHRRTDAPRDGSSGLL